MKILHTLLFTGVIIMTPVLAGQTYRQLTTAPADSAEAEQVRIWLPIESRSFCRVKISILDKSNKVIRHLVDRRLSRGYYNFYWDKKDDSGEYVSEGRYRYALFYCDRKVMKSITARYKKGEFECRIFAGKDPQQPGFSYDLRADSALVSLQICNIRDKAVAEPFKDSLMYRGRYEFVWKPDKTVRSGRYIFKLSVDGFGHTFEVRYKR